ncbi:hypothetical protein B5K08_26965 [Rhizobium leguminosarum bv. trifolii]|uniref:Uncharacterized protein n=1 Tax=Rhizobium leguminosarum bv. trifolii TaxID=386 RepID=A0A3E1B459_RHILT|nr:hypothetical protein [Rhizobium leguminosarum]RFB85147.1 hypothetical protein B5K08_26965 [Rhizobium leguminosarum bv. trifolii]RFB85543.1 hypothetical protein B5K11_29830 [Rhizobium leguminosarum bv. trifolii]RFB86214.1 hypothetical protein B5K10_25680 [Rhizobium leguminosarum bv. trifolii]
MTQHSGITKPALQPDDVHMLKTVLRQWCQEKSCDITSPAAQHVARELVSWFECGIRNEHKLSELMRHMHLELKSSPLLGHAPCVGAGPAMQSNHMVSHNG